MFQQRKAGAHCLQNLQHQQQNQQQLHHQKLPLSGARDEVGQLDPSHIFVGRPYSGRALPAKWFETTASYVAATANRAARGPALDPGLGLGGAPGLDPVAAVGEEESGIRSRGFRPWPGSGPGTCGAPTALAAATADDGDGASESHAESCCADEFTTLIFRNVPNNYRRKDLLAMLDGEGFAALYDFAYLPIDFTTTANLGYAFVNFVSHEAAKRCWARMQSYSRWTIPSKKVCNVGWSYPNQGLQANVDRYRSSPVMHPTVPDEFKPLFLTEGKPAPFPPPLKRIRAPRCGGGSHLTHFAI